MTADDQPKRRFEPPPWEREAFERFEREQAERRAAEDLEDALAMVRDRPEPPGEQEQGSTAPPGGPAAVQPESPETIQPPAPVDTAASEVATRAPAEPLPDARVQAMLVELRIEEPQAAKVSPALINATAAFLGLTGLFIVVQAGLLFARARSAEAAGLMLAATMSFLVLLVGLGFMVGAALLFRKYHR